MKTSYHNFIGIILFFLLIEKNNGVPSKISDIKGSVLTTCFGVGCLSLRSN